MKSREVAEGVGLLGPLVTGSKAGNVAMLKGAMAGTNKQGGGL